MSLTFFPFSEDRDSTVLSGQSTDGHKVGVGPQGCKEPDGEVSVCKTSSFYVILEIGPLRSGKSEKRILSSFVVSFTCLFHKNLEDLTKRFSTHVTRVRPSRGGRL